jgi:hypothetical protein
MMEWIALGLVIAKIVLDFVAPRTKTKADDIARDVLAKLPPLPATPVAKPVEGFATDTSRDHRTK